MVKQFQASQAGISENKLVFYLVSYQPINRNAIFSLVASLAPRFQAGQT